MAHSEFPKTIRVSLGSAIVLGLLKGKLDAAPTTVYLMTYRKGKCNANCGFCPQARKSHSRTDMLSRISWPPFPTTHMVNRLKTAVEEGNIKRVCIQALNYPKVFIHIKALVEAMRKRVDIPISVSCQPQNVANIKILAEAGIERIGIPLDAASKEIFEKVKGASVGGPYSWSRQFQLLIDAVKIFGKDKVSTHLIVGLGETEEELIEIVQECVDMGVLPALFAFTPIPGTALESKSPPLVAKYRRVQIARHLILHKVVRYEDIQFNEAGEIVNFGVDKTNLNQVIETGEPFRTSGCPDCNRPYYNEKPRGPMYNYPKRLTQEDICKIKGELFVNEA